MQENETQFILGLLSYGEVIRRSDGRYSSSFVGVTELEALIASGLVAVYDNQGVEFIRSKELTQ